MPNYAHVYPALKRLPQNLDHGAGDRRPARPRARSCCSGAPTSSVRRPTGWSVLYDPRYAGRVGLYDAAIELAATGERTCG